jgi:hypothetical protein
MARQEGTNALPDVGRRDGESARAWFDRLEVMDTGGWCGRFLIAHLRALQQAQREALVDQLHAVGCPWDRRRPAPRRRRARPRPPARIRAAAAAPAPQPVLSHGSEKPPRKG